MEDSVLSWVDTWGLRSLEEVDPGSGDRSGVTSIKTGMESRALGGITPDRGGV